MMICNKIKDKLYEYVYNELNVEEKGKVEQHLKECEECNKQYEELKMLLIDNMKEITYLKDSLVMPEELHLKIKNKLKRKSARGISQYAAAACFMFFLFYAIPVVAYYTVENTVLKKYIDFDNKLVKDIDEGRLEIVNKSSNLKDITFRVDGIIKKEEETMILFTVKVPEGKEINYAMPSSNHNVIRVEDQFGYKYNVTGSAMTLRSSSEDGEVTAIMQIEPLKFWSYKLDINITAMETGVMEVKKVEENDPRADEKGFVYNATEGKNLYGSWKVNFYINRRAK